MVRTRGGGEVIYAKVDVKLRDHVRAHRAGEAMATWTWALLYVREQETDGFVPDVALRGSWVGESAAREHAAKLVEVGLWLVEPDGWRICRYDQKNETREQIAERRREVRERVSSHRRNKAGNVLPLDPKDPLLTPPPGALVPGSGSGSGSDSGSREGEPERGPLDEAPEWFAKVVDSISTSQVVDLRLAECWTAYCGHATDKGKRPNTTHAAYWLTTVMVPKRRDEAKADYRQRERDKRYADHTPKYEKPTGAQAKSIQQQLAERIAAEQRAEEAAKKGAA
jgi:hypothetical protein